MRRFTSTILFALVGVLLMDSFLVTRGAFSGSPFKSLGQKVTEAVKSRNLRLLSQYRRGNPGLQNLGFWNRGLTGFYKTIKKANDLIEIYNKATPAIIDDFGLSRCGSHLLCCGWSLRKNRNYYCSTCCPDNGRYKSNNVISGPRLCSRTAVCLDMAIASISTPLSFLCLDCYPLQ